MLNDLCFEIIQSCTNNCRFCSSCASINAEPIIEYSLFKKVILYIVKNEGLKEISISGGEPFLHKDLIKMVKLCTSYGIKTNVYSSGIIKNPLKNKKLNSKDFTYIENKILEQMKQLDFSYISKETLMQLKQAQLNKIVFDFQASEPDSYNYIMGTKNNICNLLHSMLNAKSVGLCTEVHFIPMKTNYKDIEDILEICDIGEIDRISILKFVPQGRGRQNRKELALNNSELIDFCNKIELLKKKYKVDIRLGIPITKANEHLCTAGRDKLSIRYDGLILPCVAFKEMDTSNLEFIFNKNGINFKLLNIRNSLDTIKSRPGNNTIPICQQVYNNIKE